MFPMVQLSAVVYDKYKATVTGFANGVKDASAFVLSSNFFITQMHLLVFNGA